MDEIERLKTDLAATMEVVTFQHDRITTLENAMLKLLKLTRTLTEYATTVDAELDQVEAFIGLPDDTEETPNV